jgi:hypothetical protein
MAGSQNHRADAERSRDPAAVSNYVAGGTTDDRSALFASIRGWLHPALARARPAQ